LGGHHHGEHVLDPGFPALGNERLHLRLSLLSKPRAAVRRVRRGGEPRKQPENPH
jgi:hypothetical protein